jgi:hypothetical protein
MSEPQRGNMQLRTYRMAEEIRKEWRSNKGEREDSDKEYERANGKKEKGVRD